MVLYLLYCCQWGTLPKSSGQYSDFIFDGNKSMLKMELVCVSDCWKSKSWENFHLHSRRKQKGVAGGTCGLFALPPFPPILMGIKGLALALKRRLLAWRRVACP